MVYCFQSKDLRKTEMVGEVFAKLKLNLDSEYKLNILLNSCLS